MCGKVVNPEVKVENIFKEVDSYKNESIQEAEQINLVINGVDWIQLDVIYDNAEDKDHFKISIDSAIWETDTAYFIEPIAISEKGALSKLGRTEFPFHAYSYQVGRGVVNHLALGLGGGLSIDKGTNEVIFKTFGKSSEGDGQSMYTGGKVYSIKLK